MRDMIVKAFVERLRELMLEKGLTQTVLAEKTGIPRQTIGSWLTLKHAPYIDAVVQLADFFRVSIGYMVGREN